MSEVELFEKLSARLDSSGARGGVSIRVFVSAIGFNGRKAGGDFWAVGADGNDS